MLPYVISVLVLVSTLVGQGRVRIKARLADGSPWSGAEVTLYGARVRSFRDVWKPQLVRVVTDDKGRADVQLPKARSFVCWASESRRGKQRYSSFHDHVVAGMDVQLRATGAARPPRQISVSQIESVRELAPLRFVAVAQFGWRHELTLESGSLVLPPLPEYASVIAYSANGLPLPHLQLAPGAAPRLRFDALQPVRVRVVDGDGRGIGAARLAVRDDAGFGQPGLRFVPVGKTDARGYATLPLPSRGCHLRATAAGHAPMCRYVLAAKKPIDLRLADGVSIAGRLFVGSGKPAARAPILWFSAIRTPYGSMAGGSEPLDAVRSDGSGAFAFSGRDRKHAYELWCDLGDDAHGALDTAKEFPLQRRACIELGRFPAGEKLDLGDLRLDELTKLDVRVVQDDGSPARYAYVLFRLGSLGSRHAFVADRRGRVRILVKRLPKHIAAFGRDVGFGSAVPERAQVTLRLPPTQWIAGRVRTHEAKPLPGLELELKSNEVMRTPRERLLHEAVGLQRQRMRSDSAGNFRFLGVAGFRFRVLARRGAAYQYFPVSLEDGPQEGLDLVVKKELSRD